MDNAKPFRIPKRWVWDAYKRVKANRGAAGVDEQSLDQFEDNLKGNLYKLWNRLSSGSYFPPPVKRVDIAKRDGGTRPLGIPTVTDRIAQAVAALLSFLFDPTVDATNWRAEHALRPAVVNRKVCGGNRSTRGANTQQVLTTVLRTAQQRQLDAAAVLSDLLCARQPTVSQALVPSTDGSPR